MKLITSGIKYNSHNDIVIIVIKKESDSTQKLKSLSISKKVEQ